MKRLQHMRLKLAAALASTLAATVAVAQEAAPPAPAEGGGEPISTLMFFTCGAALIIAIGALVFFLRSRSNRAAAERALDPNHPANQ